MLADAATDVGDGPVDGELDAEDGEAEFDAGEEASAEDGSTDTGGQE